MICLGLAAALLLPQESKIDAPLQRWLDGEAAGRTPVFILADDQFLDFGDHYERFTKENADAKRSELGERVIKSLKGKSAVTWKAWQGLLPEESRPRASWIVNGAFANLTRSDVSKLAARSDVKYLYRSGPRMARPSGDSFASPFSGSVDIDPDPRIPWNITEIGAERVHKELKVTGEGVIVAMFDGGVDYTHPDLQPAVFTNPGEVPGNGKDDDGNGYVDDIHGWHFGQGSADARGPAGRGRNHGTMTSGIVAGQGTAGIATGVAPGAEILPLVGGGLEASLALYEYALEMRADVINMSFSQPNLGNLRGIWRLTCEHASLAGLVSSSGAGNFQQSEQVPVQQRIPEGIPCVISAGGVDRERKLVPFSSLGPVEWASVKFYGDHPMPKGLTKPDVAGFPGAGYPVLDGTAGEGYIDPNNRTRGNSFSGPHITGIVALILSANPDLPVWRVKEIIEQTARDIGPPGKDNQTGAGLANAYAAVRAAQP